MKTILKQNTELVLGGGGCIGSHMVKLVKDKGLNLLVLDDLTSGLANAYSGSELIVGDIAYEALWDRIFTVHLIDAVMHFSSFIKVSESVTQPAE